MKWKRSARGRTWFLVPVLAALLIFAGCSEDDGDSSSTPETSQQEQPQGQMPGPRGGQSLSSSDVSEQQVRKAARIASSIQMGTRADRMRMRRDMKKKYGNPRQMDSTQKKQARKEIRQRQMKMQKKQTKIMEQEAKREGMNPQMFRNIMRSARQDSVLQKRLRTAMKQQMQKQMKKQMQNRQMQNRGSQNP